MMGTRASIIIMQWLLFGLVVASCGTATTTSSRHDTLDTIPKAAAVALKRLAAGATIEKVVRERENGVEVYEATWRVDGLEREAAVTATGDLVELEEEVDSANVPQAVRIAAFARLPNAQSVKFFKLSNGNYEAEAMIDGREHDVTLTPNGAIAEEEDEEDEDDDDEDDDD